MSSKRTCPVCLSTVSSGEPEHCPECGAELDRPAEGSEDASDILRSAWRQIDTFDDLDEGNPSGADNGLEKDVAAVLSGLDFQSILHEDNNANDHSAIFAAPLPGRSAAQPVGPADSAAEQRPSPFDKALGSFKQSQAPPAASAPHDAPQGGSAARASDPVTGMREYPHHFVPDAGQPGAAGEPAVPKPRTWWGMTRQIFWLLFVLFACIVVFRFFAPARKAPTIEDSFRPGKTDATFLESINYLEKYYGKQRKKQDGSADGAPSEQAPDNATSSGTAVPPASPVPAP